MATVIITHVHTRKSRIIAKNVSNQEARRERDFQLKRIYDNNMYNDYVVSIQDT